MDTSNTSTQPVLQPTFVGHVTTLEDTLLTVEACLSGEMDHIHRFLQQHERQVLIGSGNIFVYAEFPSDKGNWGHEHLGSDDFFLKSGSFVVHGMPYKFVSYHKIGDTVKSCSKKWGHYE